MKIAFVVHDYRRMEGHSRYVVELATRFAREHEVHVFANRIEPDDERIQFHHVPAWRQTALTSILTFAVGATLKVRGRFDIIHNQGLCGVRGNVFTAHICNRAWHRALRQASGSLTLREWVSGSTLGFLEHLFYRLAHRGRVIAVSGRIAGDLAKFYRPRMPVSVIYHGVDLKTFAGGSADARASVRTRHGLTPEEMVFLFVGDMRKGGRQCIQALAAVPLGKLVFVSRSDEAPHRALAAGLGVADRVVFAGTTKEVASYYAAADALLLPTHYDSFAMVVTEAMASGLPVVVSREAGAAELIEHGVNGLLLDQFDAVNELAGNMDLLARDRACAARLGAAARQVAERYSWDAIAEQTMHLYRLIAPKTTGAYSSTGIKYKEAAHL